MPHGAGRNMYGTDQGYEIMDMFKKTYTPLRPGEEPDITNTSAGWASSMRFTSRLSWTPWMQLKRSGI